MSFGNKLKLLRVSLKLDQETVSKRLHVSQPVYSRYENDEKEVSVHHPVVQRAAAEFCVSASWLLSEENNVLVDITRSPSQVRELPEATAGTLIHTLRKQQKLMEEMIALLQANQRYKKSG